MGRNLIAYSDERVAMFNSQGHVIFEQPLEGDGPSAVEMFMVDSGIYSCFVRSDIVTVYKAYQPVGSFRIEDIAELPAEFTGVFEPLELMYSSDGKLLLTAKVGTTGDDNQSMISVFDIDYVGLKSEFVSRATIGNFASTSRTKSNVIFHVDEAKTQSFAFNPLNQKEPSKDIYKNMLQASVNDDFIFTEVAQYVEYLDLAKSSSERTQLKGLDLSQEGCRVSRPRESEIFDAEREISDAKLAIRCKDSFKIQKATGELQLKTENLSAVSHGDLLRGFVAADSSE